MGLWRRLFGASTPPKAVAAAPTKVPRVLYKYLPVDRCHRWLEERTIGFVALELLNDPYEGVILSLKHTGAGVTDFFTDTPVVKHRIGSMVDIGVNPSFDPDARQKRIAQQERLNQEIEAKRVESLRTIKSYRILSLTKTPDNMVMWAHYASNSRGLCIGIDWAKANLIVPIDLRSMSVSKPETVTVEYKEHPFESRFERYENVLHYALGRKHADWAYEREVRMLRHQSDFVTYAEGMSDKVGVLPLPPEAVTDIVLGANPDVSVRTLVSTQFQHFTGAKIRQLQISSSGYSSRLLDVGDVSKLA